MTVRTKTASIILLIQLLCAALLCGGARAAERDVFDYAGQDAAPAGRRRIVFIAAGGTHGGRGSHEFLAGATYLARRINAEFPNAFAVVYPQDK